MLRPNGWTRMLIVTACAATGYVVLALLWEELQSLLRWIDWLAPRPGLSGIALLALSPIAFMVLVAIAHWVNLGFKSADDAD